MNDRGSTTLYCAFIIFLASLVALTGMHLKLKKLNQSQAQYKMLLCAKEYTGRTKQYINRIKLTNKTIKGLQTARVLSLFIPGYGAVAANSISNMKTLIQKSQDFFRFSYMKNLIGLNNQKCHLSRLSYITPTKINSTFLIERNIAGEAKLREKLWPITVKSVNETIILNIKEIQKKKVKINSTLVPL